MGFLSGFSKVGFVENYGLRCTELFPNKNHCFPFDFNPFKAYAFLLQPHFLEVDDKSSEVKIMVIKNHMVKVTHFCWKHGTLPSQTLENQILLHKSNNKLQSFL